LRNNLLYLISLFFILTISCNFKKDVKVNPSIFISESYLKKDLDEKIHFLDSLLNSTSINNDSISRNLLFDLSTEYYYLNQYKKSLKVCKKALSKSILVKDTLGIAKSYYYMGDGYESINKDSAYYYYQKAEKMFRLIKKNEMVSRMLFNKAYILFNGGNYIESEIMVSKALKALYKNSDKKLLFTCYNLIASDFERMEEYNNSLQYYLLAKQVLNDLVKDKNDIDKKNNFRLMLSVNIASVYEKQLRYSKSETELESVLKTNLKEKWPNEYTTVIGNLGYVKTKLGNLKAGEALMKEALVLSRKSGIESSIMYKLHNLGKYYFDTKDTTQSIRYLKESLQLAEKLKSTDDIKINLQLLSKIDKANTSYYDKRYITVSDSLTKIQRKNRNKYARIEYETAVVEDANKELSNKNLYLIVGVVVLAGALGIRYLIGQRKEIAYRKRLQVAEQELFDLMQTSQIELNGAREEEQNRISRELHDNVMNKLYGTRLHLGLLNTSTSSDAQEKRSEHIDELQTIENEIRAISHDLHTDTVASHFDYPVLLATCVQKAGGNGTTLFAFESASEIDWDSISGLIKITIYRIVQEALFNVTKYADATECSITLSQPEPTSLLLTISDNGKGFGSTLSTTGIGLANMKDRTRLVKADLLIQSAPGQGTTIECKFVV
jgi:signal transduction histidine kinase/rubrerythrin